MKFNLKKGLDEQRNNLDELFRFNVDEKEIPDFKNHFVTVNTIINHLACSEHHKFFQDFISKQGEFLQVVLKVPGITSQYKFVKAAYDDAYKIEI